MHSKLNSKKPRKRGSKATFKIIVERHPEGYVAYPLGMNGVVVGEGDSYEDALNEVKSAIKFHVESFGKNALRQESTVLEAFVAEAKVGGFCK